MRRVTMFDVVFCYFAVFAVVHPGTRSGYRGTTIRDRKDLKYLPFDLPMPPVSGSPEPVVQSLYCWLRWLTVDGII